MNMLRRRTCNIDALAKYIYFFSKYGIIADISAPGV